MPDDTRLRDRVIDACQAVIGAEKIRGPVPEVLYHMTDVAGFLGIVETDCLWASLATELNDTSEVRHGLELARRILGERRRQHPTTYEQLLLEMLEVPTRAPESLKLSHLPFVVSMYSRCDRAGQWLHYGRSGRGMALGFRHDAVRMAAVDLVELDYDPDSQRRRMAALIDHGREVVESARQPEYLTRAAQIVALYLPWLALQLKHPSFVEEREWRFSNRPAPLDTQTPDPVPLKYRRSGARIIPYQEVPISARESLVEVIVGYSSPTALESVELVLRSQGLCARVERSTVPVR